MSNGDDTIIIHHNAVTNPATGNPLTEGECKAAIASGNAATIGALLQAIVDAVIAHKHSQA